MEAEATTRAPSPAPYADPQLQRLEAWWPLVARVTGFFFGLSLLTYEAAATPNPQAWIVAAGIGLTGLPVAGVLEKMLDRIGGTK